jgi:hypothetical protein
VREQFNAVDVRERDVEKEHVRGPRGEHREGLSRIRNASNDGSRRR